MFIQPFNIIKLAAAMLESDVRGSSSQIPEVFMGLTQLAPVYLLGSARLPRCG